MTQTIYGIPVTQAKQMPWGRKDQIYCPLFWFDGSRWVEFNMLNVGVLPNIRTWCQLFF